MEKKVVAKTGLRVDPYFCATKLEWLLAHVPGAAADAAAGRLAFGTIDSWLLWRLTAGAVHATDVTNASRTLLWEIHAGRWDPGLLATFSVPVEVLPAVHASGHAYGATDVGVFGAAVPITGVAGDQQAALFGQGCTEPGQTKCTYGTGCFLLQHTGATAKRSRHGLLTTRAASLDDRPLYALEGSVFVGGAAVQWFRDGLGLIRRAADIDALAGSVGDSDGVVVVPAFSGLGAPHWDADARGAILGLTRGATKAHLARATLEGIAHQVCDVVDAMSKDSGATPGVLRVDGGATRSDPLMQMQADLLRCRVERPADVEATARGAALLAGITAGVWTTADVDPGHPEAAWKPRASRRETKAARKRWASAVRTVRAFRA
jgi:glycerol kinase